MLINRWNPSPTTGITNKNFAILAPPGGGKSHAVKVAMIREWALGAKIIVIDPEREYRQLAQMLGGAWVDAAGGGTRINPLQAPALPVDTDDEGNPVTGTPLVAHIQRAMDFSCPHTCPTSPRSNARIWSRRSKRPMPKKAYRLTPTPSV